MAKRRKIILGFIGLVYSFGVVGTLQSDEAQKHQTGQIGSLFIFTSGFALVVLVAFILRKIISKLMSIFRGYELPKRIEKARKLKSSSHLASWRLINSDKPRKIQKTNKRKLTREKGKAAKQENRRERQSHKDEKANQRRMKREKGKIAKQENRRERQSHKDEKANQRRLRREESRQKRERILLERELREKHKEQISRLRMIRSEYMDYSTLLGLLRGRDESIQEAQEFINFERLEEPTEAEIFRVNGCQLIEVRKGARYSQRVTTGSRSSTGGSTGGSIRIKGVSIGGSTYRGSSQYRSNSQSISYPAPDELQQIDQGSVLITTEKIAFVGAKFSRNTQFKKIVSLSENESQILIASTSSAKVWIVQFPNDSYQFVASTLLDVLTGKLSNINSLRHELRTEPEKIIRRERNELASQMRATTEKIDELRESHNAIIERYGLPEQLL